jgi:hypothetical protein
LSLYFHWFMPQVDVALVVDANDVVNVTQYGVTQE